MAALLVLGLSQAGCGASQPAATTDDVGSSSSSDGAESASDDHTRSSGNQTSAPGTTSGESSEPGDATSSRDPASSPGTDVSEHETHDSNSTGASESSASQTNAAETAEGSSEVVETSASSDSSGDDTPSELLVPAEGVLLGAYYGDESLAETEAKLGRAIPLHLTYYAWTDDWTEGPTADDLSIGRTPFVNWELYYGGDLDEIIAGDFDDMLAERATAAAALEAKVFVDLGAEMNGEWSPWSGAENGMSADKYVAMYRHVHDAMAAAQNIIWVWCPNVTDEPREDWNAALNYYPGDDYVDWTCVDGYNWGDTNGGGWQSFEQVFQDIYPLLAQKNKPIMIGEMASAESGGDKAAWISQIVPTLQQEFPLFRGLIWFDVDKETDWRISSSSESEAAFKAMSLDPYFNP